LKKDSSGFDFGERGRKKTGEGKRGGTSPNKIRAGEKDRLLPVLEKEKKESHKRGGGDSFTV